MKKKKITGLNVADYNYLLTDIIYRITWRVTVFTTDYTDQ